MDFVIAAVSLADPSEGRDVARQQSAPPILDRLVHHGPIASRGPTLSASIWDPARSGGIEQEYPTRPNCGVHPAEQPPQSGDRIAAVKEIIDALADGSNRDAPGEFCGQERPDPERAARYALLGQGDHRGGQIHPQYVVSGGGQLLREDAAPATQFNDHTTVHALTSQRVFNTEAAARAVKSKPASWMYARSSR